MRELSIIIPILNEAKNVLLLIPEINKVRIKLNIKKFEILLIDDNSVDNIEFVVKKLKRKFKYLKLFIRKNKKKDLSQSCVFGFKKSSFKNILVMDGDNQHHPKYIIQLFNAYSKGDFDIVVGSRNLLKKSNVGLSFIRRLFSILLIFTINYLLGSKTKDPMSGFFIFKKKIYLKNKKFIFNRGYKILLDLIYPSRKKLKILDINIDFRSRGSGSSKINYKIIYFLVLIIIKKFFLRVSNILN